MLFRSEGKDILYLACTTALSGSFNTFRLVAEELQEKYPDRKIIGIDSMKCSSGDFTSYMSGNASYHITLYDEDPSYFGFEGIEGINAPKDVKAQKLIHNGQLLIIRDGKTYNAQGMLIK